MNLLGDMYVCACVHVFMVCLCTTICRGIVMSGGCVQGSSSGGWVCKEAAVVGVY